MPSITDYKSILFTGATSGIGQALALSIAKLPSNPMVIGLGRRKDRLDKLVQEGLTAEYFDAAADTQKLKESVDGLLAKYPDIDAAILCAGIQYRFDFAKPDTVDVEKISEELNINYTSLVSTIKFMLPHFIKLAEQGRKCSIMTMSSGLAITPSPQVSTYSASKAALHSFTMSLRAQLSSISPNIHVVEILPPYVNEALNERTLLTHGTSLVESELHDAQGTTEALSKIWMPLEEYTKNTMEGLLRGDENITTGMSTTVFERFNEREKQEVVNGFAKRS